MNGERVDQISKNIFLNVGIISSLKYIQIDFVEMLFLLSTRKCKFFFLINSIFLFINSQIDKVK